MKNEPVESMEYDPNDENAAVQDAIAGNSQAFSWLYNRYVGKIYNYIYYRTGKQYDAEDLTAKVFFRALRRIHAYRITGVPFSAWLYRIAHNLVANWHRDNSRKKEISLEDTAELYDRSIHPEMNVVHLQENERLFEAIRTLTPDRQQLLILKFVEHMSNAEIAAIMQRSEGAIKSLYHRTLLALRTIMEDKIEKDSLFTDEDL
ncbi:MAG: sigma-70 family RNA polymerase sigma factor [Anaerolineae bacterium]|jgi:RNA polymerase sigma-70 factor (ECF subfamily)|nr:sigma-70 family RNA polymerase sigma factor [Anaerolineae bacterium]